MNNITITLPDSSVKIVPRGTNSQEIASMIGEQLSKSVLVSKINGVLSDLNKPINEDCTLELFTGQSPEGYETLLHSTAHLMAQAVKELFPDVKISIGPTIERGFYYDFELEDSISKSDLKVIEKKMIELARSNQEIIRKEVSAKQALKIFKDKEEIYKLEIINQINPEDTISLYTQTNFTDLCRGPHVSNTSKIKYFKLLSTSGAYWRGDEKNQMLQRIYGTVSHSKKDLKEYLNMLEEAKKRDHRKLGKDLKLYTFDNEIGPGLPLWLPKGTVIINEIEKLAKEYERMQGYSQVRTPHLTKESLYQKTGHLPYYAESMYPAMEIDGTKYYIKPMNCPHHHKLFKALPRSYRDLPIKFSEYGTCYRYEKSGQLFGLMRVRSLQMNDAHIYCTKEQFKFEFMEVCKLYLEYFRIFGIEKYKMRLSLHDKSGLGEKYVNEPELWRSTENLVREAMTDGNIEFDEVEGEAAFYGPKIDVQIWSAIGREFTLATNQVDFAIPKRLKMKYINEVGNNETPLCIHRAPLGTHERFIGFLIEHFGGNFPLWLAPIQVIVIPISDNNLNYAMEISKNLFNIGIRSEVNKRSDKIGAKIRQAELEKVNIMLIVGDKEEVDYSVSVRKRFVGNLGVKPFDVVKNDILDEIKNRSISHK
tara:strand:+ start:1678 stop:3624 length:1947 start_codon:yes stop_codon:yes gene_type:complete